MKVKDRTPVVVPKRVAINPVAQAVFRAKLSSRMTTSKIHVLMLEQGEECHEVLKDLNYLFGVIGRAAEIDGLCGPEYKVLKGGIGAVGQMATSNKWDTLQTAAVSVALLRAEDLVKKLKPISLAQASLILVKTGL
jgi:hypothetical protein